MSELQFIRHLLEFARSRMAAFRLGSERGDVAEKIIIVGIFVALAIIVGALVATAVTQDARRITHQIVTAP